MEEGKTVTEMESIVKTEYGAASKRASSIARTEVGAAVEESRALGRDQAGVPMKSWLWSCKEEMEINGTRQRVRVFDSVELVEISCVAIPACRSSSSARRSRSRSGASPRRSNDWRRKVAEDAVTRIKIEGVPEAESGLKRVADAERNLGDANEKAGEKLERSAAQAAKATQVTKDLGQEIAKTKDAAKDSARATDEQGDSFKSLEGRPLPLGVIQWADGAASGGHSGVHCVRRGKPGWTCQR